VRVSPGGPARARGVAYSGRQVDVREGSVSRHFDAIAESGDGWSGSSSCVHRVRRGARFGAACVWREEFGVVPSAVLGVVLVEVYGP